MPDKKLDVRVYPLDEPRGDTRAFASVSIDNLIAIRGIRVVDSKKGLFVSMPQSQDSRGLFHDIAVPLFGDLRKEISRAVLGEYKAQATLPSEQRGYEKPDMSTASDIDVGDVKFDIRVYPLEDPDGNTKAFASVVIADLVAIRGVRVVDSEKGLFVSMPQSQDNKGLFHDIAFPLSGELRKEIGRGVLEKFDAENSLDRKPSLGDRLAAGTERAAEHVPPDRVAANVKSDAHDTTVHNTATLVGSSVRGGAQDVMVRASTQLPVPYDPSHPVSEIHMQLFRGFPDGTWGPETTMSRAQAALVFHRILVRPHPGTAPIPQDVYPQSGGFHALDAIRYFLSTGGMSLDANGNFRPTAPITSRELNQLSMSVLGQALLPDTNDPLTRILAAGLLADAQGRSRNPNTNGHPYNTFSDVPRGSSNFGLVTEMSTDHGHFRDIHGNEWWEAF